MFGTIRIRTNVPIWEAQMMNQVMMQTTEDFALVETYMLYPIILDLLEHNPAIMHLLHMQKLLVSSSTLQKAKELIMKDIAFMRKSIKLQGVRIVEESRSERGLEITYGCRGSYRHVHLLWSQIRAEVVKKLDYYLGVHIS